MVWLRGAVDERVERGAEFLTDMHVTLIPQVTLPTRATPAQAGSDAPNQIREEPARYNRLFSSSCARSPNEITGAKNFTTGSLVMTLP